MDTVTLNENNSSPDQTRVAREQIHALREFMNSKILGQQNLVTKMLISLLGRWTFTG